MVKQTEYTNMEKLISAIFVCSEDIEMLQILAGKIRGDMTTLALPKDFYEMLISFGQTAEKAIQGLSIWQKALYHRIAEEKIRQQVNEIPEQLQLPAPKRRRKPPKKEGA